MQPIVQKSVYDILNQMSKQMETFIDNQTTMIDNQTTMIDNQIAVDNRMHRIETKLDGFINACMADNQPDDQNNKKRMLKHDDEIPKKKKKQKDMDMDDEEEFDLVNFDYDDCSE